MENINAYWQDYVYSLGITHLKGSARFIDAHTVVVDGETYMPSRCNRRQTHNTSGPDAEPGIDTDGFYTLKTLPHRVAIIDAGYIGVELICFNLQ